MKTIAITLTALMLGAAPGAFAQPSPSGYGGQDTTAPDQGYQSQPGYQGYPGYQSQPTQRYPGPQGQGYQSPGYQGQGSQTQPYQGSAGAPAQGGYGAPDNDQMQQQYGQSQDDYQAQLRQYRRQKRDYDRQRAAYEAQFGGGSGGGSYTPAPPQPPTPPSGWREQGPGYYRFSETMPFRDGPWAGGDHGSDWYRDHGCRLATPRQGWDGGQGHYVPVCPDDEGHYRPAA